MRSECLGCEYLDNDGGGCVCMTRCPRPIRGYWYIVEYEYLTCSVCGKSYYTGADSTAEAKERLTQGKFYKYCPHCGTKMSGGK